MSKKLSKVLCTILAVAMAVGSLTVFANASSISFTDVPVGSWYYDAVTSCAEKGYVSGVGNNQFMPDGQLTYAQVFTMLANAFYKDEKQEYEDNRYLEMDAYFDDNPQWWSYGAYYFMDTGLLEGTEVNIKSSASANAPINRYEMVQIVTNILDGKNISVSSADKAAAQTQISDWSSVPVKYHNAVSTCFSLGIVSGYTGNRFVGTDSLTRAQACVILNTLVDTVAKGGSTKPPVQDTEMEPIYEYCDWDCDACKDCEGTIVGYKPVEKPSVPSVTPSTKDIEVTTMTSQWGVGYYVKDNGFGTGYLNNGKPITEENVLELLAEAEKIWPEGMSWKERATTNNHWYEWSGSVVDSVLLNKYRVSTNYACGGFASMVSDYLFGLDSNPMHRVYDPMDIRAGDVIVIKNANGTVKHVAVAATSTIQSGEYAGRLWTTEGNVSDKVVWPDYQYSSPTSEARQAQFNPGVTWEVWSRYPA